jgi:hypothetical protein
VTLGKYLRLVLTAAPAIAELVEKRVYSEVLPGKPTMPALVFDVVSSIDHETLEGTTEVRARRVQIDAWARDRDVATSLALAVRKFLVGPEGAAEGFVVQAVFAAGESWSFDDETKLFRAILDFEVHTSGEEV